MEPRSGEPFVLDSSVWVALFIDGDSSHTKAVQIFDAMTGYIYVPYIVLSETATVITNKYSKAQANEFLRFVSTDPRCILADNTHTVDMQAFIECDEPISFPDVSILTFALLHHARLISFDRKMANVYNRKSAV